MLENPALVAYESTARLLKTEAAGLLLPGLAHAQEERGVSADPPHPIAFSKLMRLPKGGFDRVKGLFSANGWYCNETRFQGAQC